MNGTSSSFSHSCKPSSRPFRLGNQKDCRTHSRQQFKHCRMVAVRIEVEIWHRGLTPPPRRSPMVYYADPKFYTEAKRLVARGLSPKSFLLHCVNKARKHYAAYFEDSKKTVVPLKKYFFVLQPLFSALWLLQKHLGQATDVDNRVASVEAFNTTVPPINIDDLLESVQNQLPKPVAELVHRLIQDKRQQVLGEGNRLPILGSLNLGYHQLWLF